MYAWARNSHARINRLQSYKKKLTYTIVYAIFSHFFIFLTLFRQFLVILLQPSATFCVSSLRIMVHNQVSNYRIISHMFNLYSN